jgi:putative spermidine/putrescine transport system permease protein
VPRGGRRGGGRLTMAASSSSSLPRRRDVAFVAPLFVFMLLAFDVPILLMLGWSISNPFATLTHYAYVFRVPVYLKVLGNTVRIAAITTVACVAIGYPLAYWLRGLEGRKRVVALGLVVLPFWISILIRTYAWIVILGNAGLVNRTLLALGLIGAPLPILYNELGVTIGTVNVLLPFFVLPLYATMIRIDDRLLHAAASLGASGRTVFWRVFFPLTAPALTAGAILVFMLTLGFYITPAVLGGGRVPMIANMLDNLINSFPRWERAAAISTLLLVMVSAFYVLSRWIRTRAGD